MSKVFREKPSRQINSLLALILSDHELLATFLLGNKVITIYTISYETQIRQAQESSKRDSKEKLTTVVKR